MLGLRDTVDCCLASSGSRTRLTRGPTLSGHRRLGHHRSNLVGLPKGVRKSSRLEARSRGNLSLVWYDFENMDCARAHELISAELDGETSAAESAALEEHLRDCANCAEWKVDSERLRRRLLVRPAESIPDQASLVMRAVAVPDLGNGEWIRYSLFVVAMTLLILDLPLLLTGSDTDGAEHLGRHLGAFSAALALALLYVAWRPERAIGLLPMGAVLAITLVVTAVIDIGLGRSAMISESYHLIELVGLALLWVISGGRQRLRHRFARFPT